MDYPRLLKMLRWPVAFMLLTCMASASWAQGQPGWAEERAQLKMTLEDMGPTALARDADATDRAVSVMDLSQLKVHTYNMGIQLGRIFSAGRGNFPNADGTQRSYWFTSTVAFAVEGVVGTSHPTGMVHETSDFHSLSKMDWEAKDGARGIQFSNPPQLEGSYPIYATSDLPATWPTSGWPAPESVEEVWAGTDTWFKWERAGDRNTYCIFDDAYADRENDGQSIPLGIEVKKRAIAYSALNVVYMQYEFTNTSSNNYTGVYIGHICDKGSPSSNDFADATLDYFEEDQLLFSVASNFDPGTGKHTRPSTSEQLAFVGQMVLESPTGSFREDNYDPDDPGANYLTSSVAGMPIEDSTVFSPANILTRVALIDWGDRVLRDEAALYGAVSGDISVMDSNYASNIWKTGQSGTGQPILKQTKVEYELYNGTLASVDHFYYTASGPFSMASGASFDFVVAFVGGLTWGQFRDAAAVAKHTYNIKYAGPAAPPAPGDFSANGITAGPGGREYDPRIHAYPIYYAPSGNITLTWNLAGTLTTPDPSSGVEDAEGIRLFRSMDRGSTWGNVISDVQGAFANWVPYRQWDLADGITGKDGTSYSYLGDDTGLVSSFVDEEALDGIEYWYAITAYDQGEFDPATGLVQLLPSLQSPIGSNPNAPAVIAVVSGSRPNGFTDGLVDGGATSSLTPTVSGAYPTDGTVSVNVMVDAGTMDGTYRITTADSGAYGLDSQTGVIGITLERLTPTAQVLYTALLPDDTGYGSGLLPIVDGFQVVANTMFNAVSDVYDLLDYTLPTVYVPYGGYEQLYGDDWFMNSELSHGSMSDMANRYTTIEIRFDTTATQMAYVYNRTGGYDYVGYNMFPGTAWDVDGTTDRQVNIAYTRQSAKGANLAWDIDDDPLGANRHYTSVLASDYSGATPDTAYTDLVDGTKSDWSGSNLDHMWSTIPGMDTGLTWRDLHGTTLTWGFTHPMGSGLQYEFSTTGAAIEDSLIDLDDVKVVPNPYYIYSEWDLSNNRRKIQFTNVPINSEIQIYTVSGELVAILDHHGDATAVAGGRGYNSNRVGTVDWNIWTYEFTEAAYGLYVYVLKTDDGKTKVGKFAIIR